MGTTSSVSESVVRNRKTVVWDPENRIIQQGYVSLTVSRRKFMGI